MVTLRAHDHPMRNGIEFPEERVRWESRYRDHLLGEGLAHKTVTEYVRKMVRVEKWAKQHGTHPASMSATHVEELVKDFPNTLASLGQLRSALKYYWEMLGRDRSGPYRAVLLPREEVPPPQPLEPDEYSRLIKVARGWYPEGLAVIAGLFLGLRREAIAQMNWHGFDRDYEWYRFLTKGRKVYTRPVHPYLRGQLAQHRTAYVYLFPGSRGRAHVTGATINLWVDRVSQAAGIGHVAPHRQRQTCATEMNDNGPGIEYTSEFLGHAKLTTTMRYTRLKQARLIEAMHALDALLTDLE
jgi:integrase